MSRRNKQKQTMHKQRDVILRSQKTLKDILHTNERAGLNPNPHSDDVRDQKCKLSIIIHSRTSCRIALQFPLADSKAAELLEQMLENLSCR